MKNKINPQKEKQELFAEIVFEKPKKKKRETLLVFNLIERRTFHFNLFRHTASCYSKRQSTSETKHTISEKCLVRI